MSDADAVAQEPTLAAPRWRWLAARPSRKPSPGVWREQALAEIAAREFIVERLQADGESLDETAAARICKDLETARRAAVGGGRYLLVRRLASPWRGPSVERTWGHIDAAEEALLQASPNAYLAGQLPRVLRRVQKSLAAEDPRRVHVEELVAKRNGATLAAIDHRLVELLADCPTHDHPSNSGVVEAITRLHTPRDLSAEERSGIVAAFHAANCEARRKLSRVRSFRNMLLVCALGLAIAAAGLAALGFARPRIVPLCFQPENQVVCPTGVAALASGEPAPGQAAASRSAGERAKQDSATRKLAHQSDIALIELVGLIAASVAAAAALRNARGTSTPYGVPIAVAVLKLPTGALTAVLGLLLMRGQFIPGLSALDSPDQIIAWAILFGYAQQLFTRFVDQRAQTVLDAAGTRGPEAPPAGAPRSAPDV